MSDSHIFCRGLLSAVISDYGLTAGDFTVTKSSIGGYEVQGPNKFYYNVSNVCCKWCAKADAMEHYQQQIEALKEG